MEGSSDGVFGFAATLLVLDLALHPPGTPLQQVLHAWPGYLAYVVSFPDHRRHVAPAHGPDRPARPGRRHEHLYAKVQEGEELHSTQRKFLPVVIGYVIAIVIGLALPVLAVAL
jgi:Endosomal/lysosomal potassium channel TMEM175